MGQEIHGNTATYSVLRHLGKGSFGYVVECQNMETKERVAVKMMKNRSAIKEAEYEVAMLNIIRKLDCELYNMVQFKECFNHLGLPCLVFEMLDISLWDYLIDCRRLLTPCELRAIAQQLLVAFDGLKGLGVIHSDLKPDNIMLTNMNLQPYEVKLIDFGLAILTSKVRHGLYKQPDGYRAPEVHVGHIFDEAIDMWGLGCTLAFFYLGQHLFPSSNYQSMKMMVELLGMPPDYLLEYGAYSNCYFKQEDDEDTLEPTWRLLTPEEYTWVTQQKPGQASTIQTQLHIIDNMADMFPVDDPEEYEDHLEFVDFLKGLLNVNPLLRLTPKQALEHSFITMSHQYEDSDYAMMSKTVMKQSIIVKGGRPTASPGEAQHKSSSRFSLLPPPESLFCLSAKPLEQLTQSSKLLELESSTSPKERGASYNPGTHKPAGETYVPLHIFWPLQEELVISSPQQIRKISEKTEITVRALGSLGRDSCLQEISSGEIVNSSPINKIPVSEVENPKHTKGKRSGGSHSLTIDSPILNGIRSQVCSHASWSLGEVRDVLVHSSEETVINFSDCQVFEVGQEIHGNTATYSVLRHLGEGFFGFVVECQNIKTKERVAIKMMKNPSAFKEAEDEVAMLNIIGELDCERYNMVQFKELFDYSGFPCLVFEMLDISLWDYLIDYRRSLAPCELRAIARQLLVAFDGLKGLGVIHSDLKPDNIMLTNMNLQPYEVKLIDFGLAILTSKVRHGLYKQPDGYRAPEVHVGHIFDEAIDMWGLGCTLAFLYLGQHLFPSSNYQSMKMMVELLGMPPDYLLEYGAYSNCYFKQENDEDTLEPTWRLLTPEEYTQVTGQDPGQATTLQRQLQTMDDLVNMFSGDDPEEYEDHLEFVDFLKGLLNVNPLLRLTPKQALEHSFITMSHLYEDSDYAMMSKHVMKQSVRAGEFGNQGRPTLSLKGSTAVSSFSWVSPPGSLIMERGASQNPRSLKLAGETFVPPYIDQPSEEEIVSSSSKGS